MKQEEIFAISMYSAGHRVALAERPSEVQLLDTKFGGHGKLAGHALWLLLLQRCRHKEVLFIFSRASFLLILLFSVCVVLVVDSFSVLPHVLVYLLIRV